MPRLRALAVNLLLSLTVTLLFLGALEGLARRLEPPARDRREGDFFRDWGQWEGQFYRFGAAPPSWPPAPVTNGDGLRDRHHTLEPAPGVRRVVCLGDSVTYGYELAREHAWPQQLEALIDARGGRVEVFNVAAPGWTTRQQRIAYRELARKYRAGRVLVGVCLNDVPELHNNLARPPAWLARLHRESALVRRVVGAQGREIDSVLDLFHRPDARAVRAGFERFFAELRGLRDEVRADGARLGLLVFPFRFQVEPGAPPPDVQRRLEAFAAAEGLDFVDLLPALQALGPAGFLDYCHLSPAGGAAVARALGDSPVIGAPRAHPDVLRAAGLDTGDSTALVGALHNGAAELRAAAAWALAPTPPPPGRRPRVAARALAGALEDPDPAVRLEALRALGRAPGAAAQARAALYRRLDDAHEPLRLAAAEALWRLPPDTGDVSALAGRLGHADAYVAAFAEAALQRLGPAALTVVTLALDDERAAARRRAARLLGRLGAGARSARPALERLLGDADPGVRRQAAKALGLVGAALAP
jgi:lysophospholipase L1-like esterase